MPIALSPQSPRLARVRELHAARTRRARGRFTFEGPTLLAEARRSAVVLEELYATPEAADRHTKLLAAVEGDGTPVFLIAKRVLERLSDLETPPGLLAVALQPAVSLESLLRRPGPVLLLAGVGDPGNAGTLVRSAEAFGAAGVVFGRGGADPFGPKVVRAAMGSLFRLPIAVSGPDELLTAAAGTRRTIVAADLSGEPLWSTADLPLDPIVAIGHERHGVGEFLPRFDRAFCIEQPGAVESLNASVAGSILLYVLARRAAGA